MIWHDDFEPSCAAQCDHSDRVGVARHNAPVTPPRDTGEPPLDPEVRARLLRLGEDTGQDIAGRLTELFIATAADRRATLAAALASGDDAGARAAAHTLKGSSASIGVRLVSAVCADIEARLEERDLAGATELLAKLDTELERARTALRRTA